MSDRITAGADRVLQELSARWDEVTSGEPVHRLLLAILCEEAGEAAEILASVAISADQVCQSDAWTAAPLVCEFGHWRREFVRIADRYAIDTNPDAVTGTEHLLLAAMDADVTTTEFLQRAHLSMSAIVDRIQIPLPHLDVPLESTIRIRSAEPGILNGAGLERTLDASANRCREGLRVIEDFVRYQLNSPFLQGELKVLRHQLTSVLGHMGQSKWVLSRDTTHDVGTQTTTASETFRGSIVDVLRANLKRVEESLRSLEEYSKVIDATLSGRIEQIRYRFYTIEKAIETNISALKQLHDARLYFLVTISQCRYNVETTIRSALDAGVDIIQIREKSLTDRELIEYATQVRQWTWNAKAILIINDRPDIAAIVNADGVHLGQDDLAIHDARKVLGGQKLIGVSTHSIHQARAAVLAGADYLGVGPVFPSQTKEFSDYAGLEFVQKIASEISLPWYAIGGIDPATLPAVITAGATRVAVSSTISTAPHPKGVANELASKLRVVEG